MLDRGELALRWVAETYAGHVSELSVRRLPNRSLSTVQAIEVHRSERESLSVVLRSYNVQEWLDRVPNLPQREATALGTMSAAGRRAPRLIAVDPTGRLAGVPAVLMELLPGSPEQRPEDVGYLVDGLAAALSHIHAADVSRPPWLPDYEPHHVRRKTWTPDWITRPDRWMRAEARYRRPPPSGECLVLHGDYHGGNVLWCRGVVTGVIDWVNASWGVAYADVGHCRFNLAIDLGPEVADTFLACYLRRRGCQLFDYDGYWDIAAAVGAVVDLPQPLSRHQAVHFEDFVGQALQRVETG